MLSLLDAAEYQDFTSQESRLAQQHCPEVGFEKVTANAPARRD
jgi:hypothetical protein